MKIVLSKHVLVKITLLKILGWKITQTQIKNTINNPAWVGKSKLGQATAMSLANQNHILRVIYNLESGKIKVVTIHITRRGRYEST